MNELPVIGYCVIFAKDSGIARGKHCKSPEGNVSCVVFRQKLRFWEENNAFSPLFYKKWN